jgi:hypothetical protein
VSLLSQDAIASISWLEICNQIMGRLSEVTAKIITGEPRGHAMSAVYGKSNVMERCRAARAASPKMVRPPTLVL